MTVKMISNNDLMYTVLLDLFYLVITHEKYEWINMQMKSKKH